MLDLKHDNYSVSVVNESEVLYSRPRVQRPTEYEKVFELGKANGITTAHGVRCSEPQLLHSCIVYASGGSSGVHAHSALLHNDKCILAVSWFLVALQLPELNLLWHTQVDDSSCFGVYHLPDYESYISHGELSIARVSYNGEIVWSSGGKDIFTNGFILHEKYIEVVDWNNETYHIDLNTGRSVIIPTAQ